MPDDDIDTELEVWDQFVTAVRWLARGPRPGLTMAIATEEALMGWVAEQAALEHASEPFTAAIVLAPSGA
ncbi:MAG: hypothetical protein JWR83_1495 [Aeromicrobium sp.]|nr:hypothetical protein [Aeromicrobium sp.]